MGASNTEDLRFGRPERLARLLVECAHSRLRCAHSPMFAVPTPRRFGFARRSYTTPTRRCRTPLLPPAVRRPLFVDEARYGRSSMQTRPGSLLDPESSRQLLQLVSD